MSGNSKPHSDHTDHLLFQIVHDVRALLRKGHTRAQILQRTLDPLSDENAFVLEEILSSYRDLDQLMIRLAAYADAGRSAPAEWINLNTAVLGVKLQLKKAIEEAEAELSATDMDGVRAPSAIQTVLAEVIGNAIRFRDPARPLRITISATAADDRGRIRISDNGRGWSPEYSERMFEPLRKLEVCPEGFGMGLAIARRVVEGLGGRIWAEAASAGGVFMIEIPQDAPSDGPAASDGPRDAPQHDRPNDAGSMPAS